MQPSDTTAGFIEVAKTDFFAAVGPQDVLPRTHVPSLRGRSYVAVWELQHVRTVVGRTETDSWGAVGTRFWLHERCLAGLTRRQDDDPEAA